MISISCALYTPTTGTHFLPLPPVDLSRLLILGGSSITFAFIPFSIYKISGNITQMYQKYIFGIAHLHSGLTISSARRPLSGIRLRTGTPVRYTIVIIIRIEDLEHQSRFFFTSLLS